MNKTIAAVVVSAGLIVAAAGLAGFAGEGAAPTVAAAEMAADTWTIDTVHSGVGFTIRHAGVANFHGRFNDFGGSIGYDEESGAVTAVSFEIQAGSVDTNNAGRDKHIASADFFNARQFPTISFESTGVEAGDDGVWIVTGNLTLVGETKEITAKITDLTLGTFRGQPKLGFDASFSIKRTDFGLTKYVADNGGEDGGLGNTVTIELFAEAAQG